MRHLRTTLSSIGATTLLVGLTACGGGDSKSASSSSATSDQPSSVSMAKALSSDAEATKACQTLLGPKGQKLLGWARSPGHATKLESERQADIGEVSCTVTDADNTDTELKLFNSTSRGHHELDDTAQDIYLAKDDQNVSYGVGGVSSEEDMKNLGIELQSEVGSRLVK